MITKTTTITTTENKYFNLITDEVETRVYSFIGGENPRYNVENMKYLKETNRTTETAKYALDENVFIVNAVTSENRIKGRKYMVRTFKDTLVNCLYFDIDKMETVENVITLKGDKTLEESTDIMNKGKYNGSLKFLKVLSVSYMENAFYLEETRFLELAEKVEC